MSYEQNPDQCLLSTPFSYRRSNPQLLWEFLFLLKASPSESRTPAPARLSPVTVTAKARAPAAQQQQSFFFFGPERGPAHPPATEASLNGVFCLPITHRRLQHAPTVGLLPLPNPGSQNRQRANRRKKKILLLATATRGSLAPPSLWGGMQAPLAPRQQRPRQKRRGRPRILMR